MHCDRSRVRSPRHAPSPPSSTSQAGAGSGGIWEQRSKAKAGDPRTRTADRVSNPLPKTKTGGDSDGPCDDTDGPGGDERPAAKPCPPVPKECRLYDGHPYGDMVPGHNPKARGANKLKVPETFGTTLKDCPLSAGCFSRDLAKRG